MRVVCVENKVASVSKEILDNYFISYERFDVSIGKEYIVYGMTVYLGTIWYYLADDTYSDYPIWHPSSLFDVVDGRLSRHWRYSDQGGERAVKRPRIAFPEWACDPDFYARLTDWEEKEIAIFKQYKELMDLEFEDLSITEFADQENDWLLCRNCWEAWESTNHEDALVRCPKCATILKNPKFQC